MRSCVSALAALLVVTLCSTAVRAQTTQAAELYQQAKAREASLRRQLETTTRAEASPLLLRIRTLVGAFRDLSRLFPKDGYADDSLWRGAKLSADAFWQFGQAADRTTALKLFDALVARFPSSTLVKQITAETDRLRAAKPIPDPAPRAVAVVPPAALTAVRREVLPEAVRITLEFEREAPFHAERLDSPARVFIDLQRTRVADALQDATLRFDDDVVRQVRVGRPDGGRTRIVIDTHNTGRYSVYALYNPYRVVIDLERPALGANKTVAAVSPTPRDSTVDRRHPTTSAGKPVTRSPVESATAALLPASTRAAIGWTALPSPPVRQPVTTSSAATAAPRPDPIAPTLPPSANAAGGFSLSRQLGLGVARIVIDAGHGGHDPGARIKGLTEADLVLDVARRLEALLMKQPGVEVLLTRRDDTFVPLEQRTMFANRADADLFLSIHANANANANVRGIETYFLNFASTADAEAVAARENAGSMKTMRNLPEIVRAIALNDKINESRDFATMMQASLYERLRKANRNARSLGVKQAPFMVLIGAEMPSILAEISFLTNGAESNLLKTDRYRQHIAEALLNGIMRYQRSLKRSPTIASQ
jgi:N-acetylmuramoyl-L-alanine amidase